MPAGGVFGTGATDLFCSGVAKGSKALVLLLRNPTLTLLAIGAFLASGRVRGGPRDLDARLRRSASRAGGPGARSSRPRGACTSSRARLFLGIGLLVIPFAVVITLLQWLVFRAVDLIGVVTGQGPASSPLLALVIGTTLTLLVLGLVQAATACALVEIDEGRPIGAARRLPARAPPAPPAAADDRALRRRLGRPDPDHVPDSRRALARGPLVPARARRRAGGPRRRRRPCVEARASSAAAGSGSARSSASAPGSRSSPARCSGWR